MLKALIIYAHPSRTGFHGCFLEKIEEKLKARPETAYEVLDLYALKYDPVLQDAELYSAGRRAVSPENLAFQTKVKEADRLLFVYPTWWQNMPAILKGFMDRVFTSGFAFVYKAGIPIGLLKNKKAAAFTATGGPRIYTRLFIRDQSLHVLTKDILSFVGIPTRGFGLGSAKKMGETDRKRIDDVASRVIKYLLD